MVPVQILKNAQKFYQSLKKETKELNEEIEELNEQENNNESESTIGVDENHAGVDKETGSNGFILLAGVLMPKLRTQYQFTKQNISQIGDSEDAKENWEEMTYLGSGAFSNVYKVGNGKFLKISRAASLEKSLGEELKILKVLEQRTMGSHDIRGYYYVCTYSSSACIHLHNSSKISYSLLLHVHYTYSSHFFLVFQRIDPFFIRYMRTVIVFQNDQ